MVPLTEGPVLGSPLYYFSRKRVFGFEEKNSISILMGLRLVVKRVVIQYLFHFKTFGGEEGGRGDHTIPKCNFSNCISFPNLFCILLKVAKVISIHDAVFCK